MIFLVPVLFIGWKIVKRTTWHPARPQDVDLQGEVKEIEEVSSRSSHDSLLDC
jgi:hypothetical protein